MKGKLKIFTLILIVVLVVALSAGLLVACGETSDASAPSEPPETVPEVAPESKPTTGESIGATQYFDKFDELFKAACSPAIEKGADIYFHTEASGVFGLKKEDGSEDEHFELGVETEAILDRTSTDGAGEYTSQNSAIRARVFSGSADIVALSFFVNDPTSLYIDLAGSRIKLSAEFAYEDGTLNELLGRAIGKALNKRFDFDLGAFKLDFTLNEVLDAIVEGLGEGESSLLDSLAGLMGLEDGQEIPEQTPTYDLSFLSNMFADSFKATKDGDDYSIIFDSRDTNAIAGALFGSLIGVDMLFKMNFSEDNGRFKDGVSFELGIPAALDAKGRYPYFGMRINALELLPVEGERIHMPAPLEQYKGDIAFKTEERLTPAGFKLFGFELRELVYSEAFRLDLMHPLETNETAAQIKLAMNGEQGEDVLFEVSFVRGRLTLKLAPQQIFKDGTLAGEACKRALELALDILAEHAPELETKIADALYVGGAEGDRSHIGDDFKGVTIDGIGVKEIMDDFVARAAEAFKALEDMPAPELPEQGGQGAPSPEDWSIPSLSELGELTPANIMRKRVLPALGRLLNTVVELDDGKLSVHTDDIFELLLDISNDLAGNYFREERVTEDEIFDEALSKTAEILDALNEKGFFEYDEQTPDAKALIEEAFKTLLDGIEFEDAPARREGETYAKYALRLLLANTSFDFSLDLTDGWSYELGVGIAGATLTYEHSFAPWEGLDVEELYDGAQGGWIVLDFAELAGLGE